MAAEPDPIKAVSERYCSHMNKDHADAVLYYVKYFASRRDATSAKMIAMDASGMEISFATKKSGGRSREKCRIAIEPKLKDPGEGRQRLIEMMYEAIEGLGLSRHSVNVWETPYVVSYFVLATAIFMYPYLLLSSSTWSSISPSLSSFRDSIPEWFQTTLLISVPVIHLFEAQVPLHRMMKRYRVDDKTYWKWYWAVVAIGGPEIQHFKNVAKREVARQTKEEAAKSDKH